VQACCTALLYRDCSAAASQAKETPRTTVAKVSILRIVFPLNECKLNAPFARTFRSRSLRSERL